MSACLQAAIRGVLVVSHAAEQRACLTMVLAPQVSEKQRGELAASRLGSGAL
jgi:hypothetical protein